MEYPEEGTMGVYKITSPSGKIYIGQSICIKGRWKQHHRDRNRFKMPLYRSFQKYDYFNHLFEVIEECLFEELNIRERYWQDFYDAVGVNGLNCLLTSTDVLPQVMSEETKLKIKNSCTGKVVSEETRKRLSEACKGRFISLAQRKDTSLGLIAYYKEHKGPMLGKKHSEEAKKKMSLAHTGKVLSEEQKENLRKFSHNDNQWGGDNKMAVVCLNTESGIFYDTISEAAESICIKFKTLYAMLSGRNKNRTKIIKC
jgi:group I intron endonuclease